MTIQATKKLQDFLGIKENEVPHDEDVMSLWHGNIFMIGRKKCLLLTHNESYYSVFVYGVTKKQMKELPSIVKKFLQELLRSDGFTLEQIVKMSESVESIAYAKTSDKKVLGVMNDMVHMLKYFNMTEDELSLSARINQIPYKRKDFASPKEVLKSLMCGV